MERELPASALKILLVDDSALICKRLSMLLGGVPGVMIVGTAATPTDALKGVALWTPHVVIVDLQLRGGTGMTVLREMAGLHLPIVPIVLTNYADTQFKQQCLRLGANLFFDKSTEFHRVRDAIRQMVADLPKGSEGKPS